MPTCLRCGFEAERAFRFCPECGAEAPNGPPVLAQRKTVTVLFCDLAGSTALGETLDPERLRELLARYFERMRAIVELHGGTVEKFIGDAVMAVFGVPTVHEDDALRAVRAAREMRDALPALGLEGRIGVMTGEVVTGTEERLATGDAVNVAARLEQAATPRALLIRAPTLALVRGAVDVEAVEPRDLKGKAEPVAAHRLLRVHDAPERRHDVAFVGRRRELELLRAAWAGVRADARCELVTVVGTGGVGKSRLAAELLSSIEATVFRGRCLPYGDGITYWPVVGVLKQLDLIPDEPAAAAAIRSVLGLSDAQTSAEEIAWAFRKTLEQAASFAPLVVVFEDIQWAEETFLDLVEHIALLSAGAPILLLCLARPELGELRPGWPVTLRLEPLAAAEVEELIPDRVAGELRERIARAAGGNPLFVHEMVAMADETEGEVTVPPTLRALLSARIDQLEATERSVLERGAIEGEVFHRGAVQALSSTDSVTPRLASLVRKELIQPAPPPLPGEDGFRFRHLLIRDAAYEALPKAVRADLHTRLAHWLEEHGAALVELDEIVGYHLEQACAYRAELGIPDDAGLAPAVHGRLAAAGLRAMARQDFGAATHLLERAAAALPDQVDVRLELLRATALLETGRGEDALERAESLAQRASELGDRIGELCGLLQAGIIRTFVEPEGETERLASLADEVLPEILASGDDVALFTVHHARASSAFIRGRMDTALPAFELAASHATRAGVPGDLLGWRAVCRLCGRTTVSDLLEWLEEDEVSGSRDPLFQASRATAHAMCGRFDVARAILARTRAELAERGAEQMLASITGIESVIVELLADDPATAATLGAEGCGLLEKLGDEGFLSSALGYQARALYALDRLDEAQAFATRAANHGASDDAANHMIWRPVSAKLLARRGDHAAAEELMREALAIAESTDDVNGEGDVYDALCEVLLMGGKRREAADALRQALARFERKGNLVSAERARERLQEIQPAGR